MTNLTRIAAVSSILLLSGCVNMKAPEDPTRFFLLNGAAEVSLHDPLNTGPVARVSRIQLEPYLDSRSMVLRLQDFEVQFSDINRWGEELGDNIQRALASHLMESGRFSLVQTKRQGDADFVVNVHVHRFEGVPPDIAHLSATWTIALEEGDVVASGRFDDRNQGWQFENYGHLAEKLDESVAQLAAAIVAETP